MCSTHKNVIKPRSQYFPNIISRSMLSSSFEEAIIFTVKIIFEEAIV